MKTVAAAALAAASLTAVTASPALAAVVPTTASPKPAAPAAPASTGDTAALVVGLRSDSAAAGTVRALDVDPDVQVLSSKVSTTLDAVTVTVPAGDRGDAVAALRKDPNVTYVEPRATMSVSAVTPNDAAFPQQWGLAKTKTPAAWEMTTGDPSVVVAVVDTGVTAWTELTGRVLPGYDFVNSDSDPADDNGHGTMAAGVIAAAGDNGVGGAGVCWSCKILPVKVMDKNGKGTTDNIAAGITYAADNGADVINLSLGGTTDTQVVRDAITYAASKDIVVIASAGNAGTAVKNYPAAVPAAIAVAGSTNTDTRYSWSSYSTPSDAWVDLAAPGSNWSQNRDGTYSWYVGTSSAAPVVSGVAALVRANNPAATAGEVRSALESTADPVGNYVAKGRVDAEGAVAAIENPALLPPPPVPDTTSPIVTAINTSPASPVRGSVTITPSINEDVALKSVTITVNGRVTTSRGPTWATTWNTSGLNGSYPITVTATDTSGNVGTATTTIAVDNTAPSTEVTISPSVNGTVPVELTNASADTARMDVYASNRLVGSATSAPWSVDWDTTALNGKVVLKVVTKDTAGNVGTGTRTIAVDNAGPVLSWAAPKSDALVSGSVPITIAANDTSGVAKVELIVGNAVLAEDTTAPYTFSLDTSSLPASFVAKVRGTDALGLTSTIERTFVVDNVDPTIDGIGFDPAAPVRGTVKIAPVVADDTAVKQVTVTMPNVRGQMMTVTPLKPYAVNWATTGLNGTFPITVTVTDTAGNTATTVENVTVDNTVPSAAITLATSVSGTAPITLTSPSADTALLEVLVNNKVIGTATSAPWTVNWVTDKLSPATYAITIRTTDTAGNRNSFVTKAIADNVGPATVWTMPKLNSVLRGNTTFAFSASDISGVAKLELLSGTTVLGEDTAAPWSITADTNDLSGAVPLTVRATDRNGLVTESTRTYTVDNLAPVITGLGLADGVALKGTVRINPIVSDDIAIKQVKLTVPSTKPGVNTAILAGAAPWTLTWKTTGVADGTYPVTLTVTDTAGNSTDLITQVTIDN